MLILFLCCTFCDSFTYVYIFFYLFIFATADSFKSMYDEPRRAAVEKVKNNRKQQSKSKEPKPPAPPKKRHVKKQAPPSTKNIEESSSSSTSSSSSSSSESDIDVDTDEDKKIDDIIKAVEKKTSHTPKVHKKLQKPPQPIVQIPPHDDDEIIVETINNKDIEDEKNNDTEGTTSATEDEILNNLIMYEHNYFERLPPISASAHTQNSATWNKSDDSNILKEQNKNNISRTGPDGVALVTSPPPAKRRRESPEKAELKYKFRMRTKAEEEKIIWNIYDNNNDLDEEDVRYLKEAFESLQQVASKEVESYAWTDFTRILFNYELLFNFLWFSCTRDKIRPESSFKTIYYDMFSFKFALFFTLLFYINNNSPVMLYFFTWRRIS